MRELSLNNCRVDKRYDICDHLGRGSYAEIFLAHDLLASPQSPHSKVVIKALNVFLQNDLDADLERTLVENIQNEAIALDRVRHPNIISRLGHGTARDLRGTIFHYLVLEYLPGGDLQTLLRRKQVPLDQALNYVEQVCAGLAHAHRNSIIHRDIKPHNLLLTQDLATIKIADFGVARVHSSDSPITRVGTNIYAPPEHSPMSAGQTGTSAPVRLTPAADIYSLAKTIYTLLTGEPPRAFANEAITDLPESVRGEQWCDDLKRVLKRATDHNPALRHQTIEDFWADLAGVRQIAADGEFSTLMTATVSLPQPHVSRGYTPLAPERPSFEPISGKLPAGVPTLSSDPAARSDVDINIGVSKSDLLTERWPADAGSPNRGTHANTDVQNRAPITRDSEAFQIPVESPLKRGRMLRRFATFAVALCLFTGILYGTARFMRGRISMPELSNPFSSRTGKANTDIYLRPSPNTDNDPIGLVTKNSKVRIVNSQNNWYQVDVVQQGRERPGQPNATRGWLNGKYLELSDN